MQDNPGGDALDSAEGVRRLCKKKSSVLSCLDKRTREGCDRGSKVGTLHSGLDREGASSSEDTERIWQNSFP